MHVINQKGVLIVYYVMIFVVINVSVGFTWVYYFIGIQISFLLNQTGGKERGW